MEMLLELILGTFIYIIGEILFELMLLLGLNSIAEVFSRKKERNMAYEIVGWVLLGMIGGFLSLWIQRKLFFRNSTLQILNVLLSPFFVAFLAKRIESFLPKRGSPPLRVYTLYYYYLFALLVNLIRWIGGV